MNFMSGGSVINFDRFSDGEDIQKKAMESAAQGGPNSGFEIEGVDFFKDPELANQFPEMKDDIDLIVSTESYIHRLIDLRTRIHESKGISRGMAHEMLELIPSLEGFTPRQFTEELSSIGAQPSLEALSAKIWALIAAAIVFVIGLIYKFIKWMTGGKSDDPRSLDEIARDVREADKKVDEQAEAVDQAHHVIKSVGGKHIDVPVPNAVEMAKVQTTRLPEELKTILEKESKRQAHVMGGDEKEKVHVSVKLIDVLTGIEGGSAIARYMENPPKIARVIYANRDTAALQMTLAAFEGFSSGASLIAANLDLLKDMMKDIEEDQMPKDSMQLAKLSSRMQMLDELLSNEGKFKVGGKTYPSMAAWAVEYRNEMNNEANYSTAFHSLEEFLEAQYRATEYLKSGRFDRIAAFFHLLKDTEPVLSKLAEIAKKQNLRDIHIGSSAKQAELTSRITRVSRTMSSNLRALMVVYEQVGRVYSEVTRTGAGIVKRLYDNAHRIVKYYENAGFEPPSELVDIADELEEARKRADASVIAPNLFDDPYAGVAVVSSPAKRVVINKVHEFGAEEAKILQEALSNLRKT